MAASTITRTSWTDDDGTGTTGTIINNAQLQAVYDAIDQLFSGAGSYTTLECGGGLKVDGVLDLAGYKETDTALSIASNVLTVNLALGSYFHFTLNANITTMTLQNVPASGKLASFILDVTANGSAFTWSWLTSTVKWAGGGAPTVTTTNGKVDRFAFLSRDGGTTWIGMVLGQVYAS